MPVFQIFLRKKSGKPARAFPGHIIFTGGIALILHAGADQLLYFPVMDIDARSEFHSHHPSNVF